MLFVLWTGTPKGAENTSGGYMSAMSAVDSSPVPPKEQRDNEQ